jgi:hypothetical protein
VEIVNAALFVKIMEDKTVSDEDNLWVIIAKGKNIALPWKENSYGAGQFPREKNEPSRVSFFSQKGFVLAPR